MKKLIIIFTFLMANSLAANIWQELPVPYEYISSSDLFELNDNIITKDYYLRDNKWVTYKSGNWVAVENEFISNIDFFHAIDQKESNVIISTGKGIFFSDDSAQSWTELSTIKDTPQLSDVEINNDGEIFGLTVGFGKGLYKYNGSENKWRLVDDKQQDTTFALYIQDIESNDEYLFALQKRTEHPLRVGDTLEGGIYISDNSGQSWEKKLVDSSLYSIFVIKDTILVCTTNGYLIRSEDNGNTWNDKYIGTLINYYLYDNGAIIAGSNPKGAIKSDDYGKTWQVVVNDLYPQKIYKTENKYFYHSGYIFESDTNFINVKKTNHIVDSTNIYRMRYHNDTLFATGTFRRGLQYSTDFGESWQTYSDYFEKNNISLIDVNFKDDSVLICPANERYSEGYYYSHDNGNSWDYYQPDYFSSNPYLRNVVISDNKILFNTGSGIMISEDNGVTQNPLDTSVIKNNYRVDHLVKTKNGKLIAFTFNNGVFESTDNAENWEQLVSVLPTDTNFASIQDFYKFNGKYFAVNATPLSIVASDDSGQSWYNMNIDFTKFDKSAEIFMIDENSILLSVKDGIFISNNAGITWDRVGSGLIDNVESRYQIINNIGDYVFIDGGGKLYKSTLEKLGIITLIENDSETENYVYTMKPYPLPASNRVTVDIYLSESPETIQTSVYNSEGVKIDNGENIEITGGRWPGQLTWECGSQSPGVYYIQIISGSKKHAIPVVVGE